jgi:two-component system sensor histidine kinase TctE
LATLAPVTARMIHLVNQLLTLAKAEGGSDTAMEMVDLAQLAQDLAAEWMPQAIEKDIDLGLEVAPAAVRGQTFLLRELVSNLLDNAIRYSPQGGRVTLRTRALEGMAILEVEDEGPGIPPAERRHVFRRFYRLNAVSSDGCGLGLAIVDEIARIHGARVSIEDASGAGGILVSVVFPSGSESATDTKKDCADSDISGRPRRP